MKFYCFPQKQTYCSLYSSYSVFKTRLFSNFILQASPKNSFLFRIRKTYLGHLLSSIATINVTVPNPNSEYVGIRKTNKLVLIELKNKVPIRVWKKESGGIWKQEAFLGYQLFSEFSLKEFTSQEKIVKKALSEHWKGVKQSMANIHGDFTHFNILYDENGVIHLIDRKNMDNSKLFDFFYFYAYLVQSINSDLRISKRETIKIIHILESWLQETCKYNGRSDFENDFNNIKIPNSSGISIASQKQYLDDFYNLF